MGASESGDCWVETERVDDVVQIMISIDEALQWVMSHTQPPAAVEVPLTDSCGLVLDEDVASDIDSPPHDKSLVDGYALRSEDLTAPTAVLRVIEEVTAGAVPGRTVISGTATRIMTGAPIPLGADAVVKVEDTTSVDSSSVCIETSGVLAGTHILSQAASLRRGDLILRRGTCIRPIEIGILAEIGRALVAVRPRPQVAVVATGNELVPVGEVPQPGQIRNSNAPMLSAMAEACGAIASDLGICADDTSLLRQTIERGLERDVLVLSGGVSAGVLGLGPKGLRDCGVQETFHKVNLKPGKPLWFGVLPQSEGSDKLVFGLPGNPVSSLVCFHLFVRPAIGVLAGEHPNLVTPGPICRAKLSLEYSHRSDRPTYAPARATERDEELWVEPLQWHGSADLATLARANCLLVLPGKEAKYPTGSLVEILQL